MCLLKKQDPFEGRLVCWTLKLGTNTKLSKYNTHFSLPIMLQAIHLHKQKKVNQAS